MRSNLPTGADKRWIRLGLAIVAVLITLTFALVPFGRSEIGPNPNGYEDLVAAGRSIAGAWPSQRSWLQADLAELRPYVAKNQPAIERARLGISREGLIQFADSHQGLDHLIDQQGQVRALTMLLFAAARLAFEDGRYADQVRLDLEILAVGQMMTQGSIGSTAAMGWIVQGQALDQLKRLSNHLDVVDIRYILPKLEAMDQRRVTPEAVERRRARWYAGAFRFWERGLMRAAGVAATGRAADQKLVKEAHDRTARSMRYLMVQWAIHQFHQETGRWPHTVDELVPSILTRVPLNPDTNQPLIYPANSAGELTDDLAAIGAPDGSVNPSPSLPAPGSPGPDHPTTNPQPPPPPTNPTG